MKHLKTHGFFKIRCMPFWYVCVVEALAKMKARKFRKLFLKAARNGDPKRWDGKRKINDVHPDDVLYDMITKPVRDMTKKLGLLDVVGGSGSREVGACSLLKSLPVPIDKPIFQGMHADMSPYFDWGDEFGLSTITAGSTGAEIHIYPGSFDGGVGSGQAVSVTLEAGETCVLNGLSRHRGVSYPNENHRFFVSFVVRRAVGKANKDRLGQSVNALQHRDYVEGEVVIPFDQWVRSILS